MTIRLVRDLVEKGLEPICDVVIAGGWRRRPAEGH